MTLLPTEIMVECPRMNLKVSVRKVCRGETACQHYQHYAVKGDVFYIVCSYGGEKP